MNQTHKVMLAIIILISVSAFVTFLYWLGDQTLKQEQQKQLNPQQEQKKGLDYNLHFSEKVGVENP